MSTNSLAAAERYFQEAMTRLPKLLDGQRDALDRAAGLCTDAIAADGLVHLFGVGHSRMMCEEMTPRQGCFVGWHTIVEMAEGAKRRGLAVIALVSKAHCDQAKPALASGRKLTDVADVVLDNGAP